LPTAGKDLRFGAFLMDVSERSILMASFAHFTDIAQFLFFHSLFGFAALSLAPREKMINYTSEMGVIEANVVRGLLIGF